MTALDLKGALDRSKCERDRSGLPDLLAGMLPGDQLQSEASWSAVLDRYSISLDEQRVGGLLAYGALRAVTDSATVIVKRNEQRLWSATAARDDAEATAAQAMALQRA